MELIHADNLILVLVETQFLENARKRKNGMEMKVSVECWCWKNKSHEIVKFVRVRCVECHRWVCHQ